MPEVPSRSRKIPLIRRYILQKIPGPHTIPCLSWAPQIRILRISFLSSMDIHVRLIVEGNNGIFLSRSSFFHDAHARIDLMAASREILIISYASSWLFGFRGSFPSAANEPYQILRITVLPASLSASTAFCSAKLTTYHRGTSTI